MFTASSAAVATSMAVARLFFIICCGQLVVISVNAVDVNEVEEKLDGQLRDVNAALRSCQSTCLLKEEPVCGSDQITYNNECVFEKALCRNNSISIKNDGKCSVGNCRFVCTQDWDPVCGNNGETYGNKCSFIEAYCRDSTLTLMYFGECPKSRYKVGPNGMLWHYEICPLLETKNGLLQECKDACSQNGECTAFNFVSEGAKTRCELLKCPIPIPEPTWNYGNGWVGYALAAIECSSRAAIKTEYDPVCGNDGKTYQNIGTLEAEKCKQPALEIDHEGICLGECLHFDGEVVGEKCLYFSGKQDKLSWNEAETACSKKIGELARFDDQPVHYLEMIEERENAIGTGISAYWIGGHDPDGESNWEWNNGVNIPQSYLDFPWDLGEPSSEGVKNCLDINEHSNSDQYMYYAETCYTKQQYICEIGCSFNGVIYPPGSYIQDTCSQLQCDAITGRFINRGYDDDCYECTIWGDPHIIPYDRSSQYNRYIAKQTGNCLLSWFGSRSNPSIAVYGQFVTCGYGDVSCLGDVTFKNDENTVLNCHFDTNTWKMEIKLNGMVVDVDALTSSPSLIKIGSTDYPILAWTSTYQSLIGDHYIQKCVSLQGSSGIKVQFCGDHNADWANSVNIWATPEIVNNLSGFCGRAYGNVEQFCDQMTRSNAINSTNESVVTNSSLKPKCETNSSLADMFQSQCEDAILNGVHTARMDESQYLIDACIFDLCHVSDPDEWMKSIHAAMPKHHEIRETTVGHCLHKRTPACKNNNGTCILKTEICDGTIINRGCHGKKCICCAPNPCDQDPECVNRGGKCILRKDWAGCDGSLNSELCSGPHCACCYINPQTSCKKTKGCSRVNGECMARSDWENCDGELKIKWCKGNNCGCCYKK